jgi:hypothetical protein
MENGPVLKLSVRFATVLVPHAEPHTTVMSQTEFKSLDDAHRYNQELAARARRAEDDLPPHWARVAKRITLMILLAGAFLIYYLLDKMQEAISLLK